MKTYATKTWKNFLEDINNHLDKNHTDWNQWYAIRQSQSRNDGLVIQYLDAFENDICKLKEFDFIFEFGPGHGRVCKAIHNRGFNGNYVCFDFPEMIEVQKMFLGDIKPTYLSDTDDVMKPQGKNLFISMMAIEEAPYEIHDWFFEYAKQFDAWLFKFSGRKCMFEDFMDEEHWEAYDDFQHKGVYLRFGDKCRSKK